VLRNELRRKRMQLKTAILLIHVVSAAAVDIGFYGTMKAYEKYRANKS
jgi:hypothetical protein